MRGRPGVGNPADDLVCNAERRGGNCLIHSLDFDRGEKNWQSLQSRDPDPDRLFTLAWANSVLELARERVALGYQQAGKQNVFDVLIGTLSSPLGAEDYAQLGQQLGISSSAVKVAMHRLRQRYGGALREVIAETVDDPSEIDLELRELLQALS